MEQNVLCDKYLRTVHLKDFIDLKWSLGDTMSKP